jgi:hypothetical protein
MDVEVVEDVVNEGESDCDSDLWRKMPVDIFINHVMPYVYKKQNMVLLDDIRNFYFDYQFIVDYYFSGLNEFCLLVDLIFFCNGGVSLIERVDGSFIDILDRNILFCNFPFRKKCDFINRHFYLNAGTKTEIKNKFLLSLMTSSERARFINEFLILDFE